MKIDISYVIGSALFYVFIIIRILLTTILDSETIISDVEGALGNCPKCQLTLTLPCFPT